MAENTYALLKAAGFSDQEILAEAGFEAQQPQGSSVMGGVMSALKGATRGFSDEIGANVEAGLGVAGDLLSGHKPVDRYDQALAGWRGEQEQFAEANPALSTGLEIGGNLALAGPTKLAGMIADAAAYGAGSGEGDAIERGKNALASALLVGGSNAAMKGIGAVGRYVTSKMPEAGLSSKLSALGISRTDMKKAIKGKGKQYVFEKTGEHPTETALKLAESEGVIGPGLTLNPSKLTTKTQAAVDDIAKETRAIITQADNAMTGTVKPQLINARAFVSKVPGAEQDAINKVLKSEEKAISKQLDGSLTSLQSLKERFGAKAFSSDTSSTVKDFYRQLTRDLKETIENKVDELTKKGKLKPDAAAKLKELNAKEGSFIGLKDHFVKEAAAEKASDAWKKAIPTWRTSGGFGVPIAAAYATAGLPAALLTGGLGAALVSKQGRYLTGEALQQLAERLPTITPGAISNPLSRALVTGYNQ